jgi:hypothetical protein
VQPTQLVQQAALVAYMILMTKRQLISVGSLQLVQSMTLGDFFVPSDQLINRLLVWQLTARYPMGLDSPMLSSNQQHHPFGKSNFSTLFH